MKHCNTLLLIWIACSFGYPVDLLAQSSCRVDQAPVKVLLYYPEEIGTGMIGFDNKDGETVLEYRLSIEYERTANTIVSASIPLDSTGSKGFSKILRHEEEVNLSYDYGATAGNETVLATRYRAGTEGMNISDVGTWFIAEDSVQGTIRVEIRAGGTSIDDAIVLTTGKLDYATGMHEENGKMYNIQLEKEVAVYPDEIFYVVFTYPSSKIRPQGCVKNDSVDSVAGRYWVYDNGVWKDFQQQDGNLKSAFIMYAAEKTPKNISWLKILSDQSGLIFPGKSSFVKLQMDGSVAVLGDQHAKVVFHTNDSVNPIIKVPVTLRMNEAPYFYNAPTEINVVEGTSTDFEIDLVDIENDTFIVKNLQGSKIVSYKISGSRLILTVAPHIGDVGTYQVKYQAMDKYGAGRELTIPIFVAYKNRPPVYSETDSVFIYSIREKMIEYNIRNLFSDPDGDNFTYKILSGNQDIAEVDPVNDSVFVIRPKAVGETVLDFTVTDARGEVTHYTVDVVVGLCVNPSGIIVQKWNNVLLVNNSGNKYKFEGYQWYKNNEPMQEATGQYYSAGDKSTDQLDFSAEYYVRLITESNDTLYTCPMIPGKMGNSLKAYPNPVLRGSGLTIETELPDMEKSPVTVQIISMSGQVVKTLFSEEPVLSVPMPFVRGVYIVKVKAGENEKVFNINVE